MNLYNNVSLVMKIVINALVKVKKTVQNVLKAVII